MERQQAARCHTLIDHMRVIGCQPVTALDLDDGFRWGGIGKPETPGRGMIRESVELTEGCYRLKRVGNWESYKRRRTDEVAKRRGLISIGTSLAAVARTVL